METNGPKQFNQLIGCLAIYLCVFTAAALIIGYWATH